MRQHWGRHQKIKQPALCARPLVVQSGQLQGNHGLTTAQDELNSTYSVNLLHTRGHNLRQFQQ